MRLAGLALGRGAVIAFGLMGILVLTLAAFRLPIGDSLRLITQGAFGSEVGIARTLVKSTPLMLAGLGIVVAWRAGMFNIGGEGQFVLGALTGATLFRLAPHVPPVVLNPLILVASVLGGAVYAGLAGWLQVRRGVSVVISTILLNFIAIQMLDWAVAGPLQQAKGQLPMTERLPEAAMLLRFNRQTDLHSGVILAWIAAGLVFVFLYLTRRGFQLRLVGENPSAARVAGLAVGARQVGAMALSGGLCGLAGGVEYTALAGQLGTGFAQQWGFLAIPVALLGGLHPLGVIPSATIFGALFAGSENLARFTPTGSTLVYVIQAAAVLGYLLLNELRERRAKLAEGAA